MPAVSQPELILCYAIPTANTCTTVHPWWPHLSTKKSMDSFAILDTTPTELASFELAAGQQTQCILVHHEFHESCTHKKNDVHFAPRQASTSIMRADSIPSHSFTKQSQTWEISVLSSNAVLVMCDIDKKRGMTRVRFWVPTPKLSDKFSTQHNKNSIMQFFFS